MKLYYKIFPPLLFFILFATLATVGFWVKSGNSIFLFIFFSLAFLVLGITAVFFGIMVVMTILRIPAVKVIETHLIVRLPLEKVKRIPLEYICGVPQPYTTSVGVDFEVFYINPKSKNGLIGFVKKVKVPMGLISTSNATINAFLAKLYPHIVLFG